MQLHCQLCHNHCQGIFLLRNARFSTSPLHQKCKISRCWFKIFLSQVTYDRPFNVVAQDEVLSKFKQSRRIQHEQVRTMTSIVNNLTLYTSVHRSSISCRYLCDVYFRSDCNFLSLSLISTSNPIRWMLSWETKWAFFNCFLFSYSDGPVSTSECLSIPRVPANFGMSGGLHSTEVAFMLLTHPGFDSQCTQNFISKLLAEV